MGLIPNDVITQVLDRCDIVEIVSSYTPLKQTGRNFKTNCPFHHEKTPSFIVNPDKQIFHCFGCGVGGNVISYVILQEHLEFPEAVRYLAQRVGISIPTSSLQENEGAKSKERIKKTNQLAVEYFQKILFIDKSSEAIQARQYLKRRGVDSEMARKFRLGFALNSWEALLQYLRSCKVSLKEMEDAGLIIPRKDGGFYDRFRGRVIFPIFDVRDSCIAFGARTMESNNDVKYINSPETDLYKKGSHLYGLNWSKGAVSREDAVIIVEGYMDFISPFEQGIENIVASLGTALTPEQVRLLRRYTKNVIMLFDADPAGEAAMFRSLDLLIEEDMYVRVVSLDKGADPDSFVRQSGPEALRQRITSAESLFEFKRRYLFGKYKGKTVEDRARIAGEILPTIHKVSNAVIKSEEIKRLSQALAVSQEALIAELRKIEQKFPMGAVAQFPMEKKTSVSVGEDVPPVERSLVKLMLDDSQFIASTRQEVDILDFQSIHVRQVLERIFDLHDQGVEINARTLMNFFSDQSILNMISHIMTSDQIEGEDKRRVYSDCLRRFKEKRLKRQTLEIRTQMEDARGAGDQKKLEELTKLFNQITRGRINEKERTTRRS